MRRWGNAQLIPLSSGDAVGQERGGARSLVLRAIALMVIGVIGTACWVNYNNPHYVDFIASWSAARMGAEAYDIGAHHAVEVTVARGTGLLPFPYPPPFLLFIAPLALLDYGRAFVAWTIATAGIFLLASRSTISLSHPAVLANGLVGQNGLLTSGIFMLGINRLERQPVVGGAILGLLVIKPHLAALIPLALFASRQWHAFFSAAGSVLAVGLLSLLAFGPSAWTGFFRIVADYPDLIRAGAWSWNSIASVFALARFFGVAQTIALIFHAVVAMGAAAAVYMAWRQDWYSKVPILAAASTLISPYFFNYDCVLLAFPMMALPNWRSLIVAWSLAALPVATYFGLYAGPNTMPLAAVFSIYALTPTKSRFSRPIIA